MCALPIVAAIHPQSGSQPPGEPCMAKPAAELSASSLASMQSNQTMTPEALALAIQMVSASNMLMAADLHKAATRLDEGIYTGDLKNGQPHGRGVLQYAASDKGQRQKYEGEFSSGLPHGEGTMTWLNGDKYTGGWKNGQKHGHGNQTYADGRNYQGAYEDGMQQGQGELKWPNGKAYTGLFEKDEVKVGKLIHPNGSYAEGSFKEGRLWDGILYHLSPQGRASRTKYKNGKEDTCNIS
jgi:hypothetical protein